MATQVNTKFVVKLAVVLVVGCAGIMGLVVYLMMNTGADLARAGDKQMAVGNYKDAGDLYAKAVNKEKTNTLFLKKWAEALRKQTPETQPRYMDAYHNLESAQRQLAMVQHDDLKAQREYLDMEKSVLDQQPQVRRDALDAFIREADGVINQHAAKAGGDPSDVLRRYRGLARLRLAAENPDAGKEYLDGAEEDLKAALAADPSDVESARGLERLYMVRSLKADEANDQQQSEAMIAKGGEVVSDFLKREPNNPGMLLAQIRRDYEAASRDVRKRTDKPDIKKLSDEFHDRELPKLEAASAAAMALPPEKIDRALIGNMRQMEGTIDPAARQSRSEALLRQALKARPDDVDMLSALADILESRDDHAGAVAELQKIVDMPAKPVSIEGAMLFDRRSEALLRQGLWTVEQWQALQADPDKNAQAIKDAANKVREVRDKLGGLQAEGSLGLILLDANLAFMNGDFRKATQFVEQFEKASSNASPEALMLGAQVALRLNEPGSARKRLKQLLDLQPTNIRAAYILAGLDMTLQQYDEAKSLYEGILRLVPDNPQATEGLKLAIGMQAGANAKISDPVIQAVIQADAMAKDASQADGLTKAIDLLKKQIAATGPDPRLVRELAVVEMNFNNNKAGAVAALRQGLSAHPDDKNLQVMMTALSSDDPLATRLKLIDEAKLSEGMRCAERYSAYKAYGKKPEALAELDKAVKAEPDNAAVLELVFIQALEDKDYTKAGQLADRAQKDNLDKAGGATYRARLAAAQGHPDEGARVMEDLVKAGGAQPESWRLLGRLQNQLGRRADAIKSFQAALDLRPNDVPTIKDLLTTQVVMGQSEDALNTARRFKVYADGDDEFTNLRLSLEAQFGNRKAVIEQRERIAKQDPKNNDNLLALAGLYMDDNQRDKARPCIDSVRAAKDSLDAVNLDAAWYWAGQQRDKAKSVYEAFIASLDKGSRLQPSIAYAQFLGQRQDADGSIAVLEQARQYQTQGVDQADRILGDTLLALHRPDDAIAAFKRVVDDKADTKENMYLKRMIEVMIANKRFAEADTLLAPLMAGAPDSVTMLLAADLKAGQNDPKARRQLLDRAVSQFPNEPVVFIKRAQFLLPTDADEVDRLKKSTDPADAARRQELVRNATDAREDLNRALQLQPDVATALRLRSIANEIVGDTDASVADLRSALLANPSDLDTFRGLANYLIQTNRAATATEVATAMAAKRPGDAMMRYNLGTIFAGLKQWDAAADFLRMAFELDHQDGIAQRYVDYLLNCTPPNVGVASDVLTKDPVGPRVKTNPGLLMAQARLQMAQNKMQLAGASTVDALRLLDVKNPRDIFAWYNDVQRLEPDPAQLVGFLDQLSSQGVATEWLTYFRANIRIASKNADAVKQGTEMLRGLLASSKNPPVRQIAARILGMALYNQKAYDDAEKVMRAELAEFPDDPENMNNLAYMLAKDLNRPADGLPLAQNAAKLNPGSAEVLDTLGIIQVLTGKLDEGVQTLTQAQGAATSPGAAATIGLHLADALWSQGKKDEARKALAGASGLITKLGDTANPQTKTDLEELQKKITGP